MTSSSFPMRMRRNLWEFVHFTQESSSSKESRFKHRTEEMVLPPTLLIFLYIIISIFITLNNILYIFFYIR